MAVHCEECAADTERESYQCNVCGRTYCRRCIDAHTACVPPADDEYDIDESTR